MIVTRLGLGTRTTATRVCPSARPHPTERLTAAASDSVVLSGGRTPRRRDECLSRRPWDPTGSIHRNRAHVEDARPLPRLVVLGDELPSGSDRHTDLPSAIVEDVVDEHRDSGAGSPKTDLEAPAWRALAAATAAAGVGAVRPAAAREEPADTDRAPIAVVPVHEMVATADGHGDRQTVVVHRSDSARAVRAAGRLAVLVRTAHDTGPAQRAGGGRRRACGGDQEHRDGAPRS